MPTHRTVVRETMVYMHIGVLHICNRMRKIHDLIMECFLELLLNKVQKYLEDATFLHNKVEEIRKYVYLVVHPEILPRQIRNY